MNENMVGNSELIKGIGFSNFRSIGESPVLLYPLKKINVLIGPNNSGKTNILSAIDRFFSKNNLLKDNIDYPNYDHSKKSDIFTPILFDELPNYVDDVRLKLNEDYLSIIKASLQTEPFFSKPDCDVFWKGNNKYYDDSFFRNIVDSLKRSSIYKDTIRRFFGYYNNYEIDLFLKRNIEIVLNNCHQQEDREVVHINALRDLFDNNKNSFIDETIIEKIKYLSNPDSHDLDARHTMRQINEFVSEMLGYDVKLVVPHSGNTININRVDDDDVVRNLSQIGSGIQEMIYIAIVSTLKPNQLICFDEPEIHLHPRLLRKLVKYLEKNTNCQYIFSTHSNCFLDNIADDISVFKVSLSHDGYTEVEYAASTSTLGLINSQLGYRASELLQSNCIIWVEGPSDRLYINFWIHSKKHDLMEGIDYSIMFYGGRLLNHITSESDSDKDLIELLKINRHSYIVMDSDKKTAEFAINPTKERIFEAFSNTIWITQGREIENYLPYEVFNVVLKDVDKEAQPVKKDIYVNRLKKRNRSIDKVEFARRFTSSPNNCDFSIMDLNEQVEKLICFIEDANR